MNQKKWIVGIIVILLVSGIVGGIWYNRKTTQPTYEEYIPEEEITEEQFRQSMVTLYYYNTETQELTQQSKLIDVKELLENPYIICLQLMMQPPHQEYLEGILPEGTTVHSATLQGNTVVIDFSKEFVENHKVEQEYVIIRGIVLTLTQFTEVDGVRITIEGEENGKFSENGISFEETFTVNTMAEQV